MNIEYKDIHDFECEDLERLFLSVEWSSGHFPDKLAIAMKNFNTVGRTVRKIRMCRTPINIFQKRY